MSTLMQASNQWASRPADERFLSLIELQAAMRANRAVSASKVVSSRALSIAPVEDNPRGLCVIGPNGAPVTPTHWSFGQLAGLAAAPAGYLRELPAPIAADCLNYGIRQRDAKDVGVLLRKNAEGVNTLAAATGPNYGRIWNATVADNLVSRFGDGVSGDFRVPGEFGKAVAANRDNTTIYGSDRDMFVFLADEEHRITVPNRRNGESGEMARGFFVWNSEVGAQTFGVATFLFDYVCMNRIVWGATQYREIRIRHTASAPDRWMDDVVPAIQSYANSRTDNIVAAITHAKQHRLDDLDAFLAKRFTKSETVAIKAAHMADEQRPMENLWDVVVGATAAARAIPHQDARVDMERKGGAILDMAAA